VAQIEDSDWWPELVEVINDYSLLQLCKRFGTDPVELVAAMNRTGVKRQPGAGTTAKKKGPKANASKLDPFVDIVGTMSDSEVAKKAGVSPSAVLHFRRTRGIDAYDPKKAPEAPARLVDTGRGAAQAEQATSKPKPKPKPKSKPKPKPTSANSGAAKRGGRVLKRSADRSEVVEVEGHPTADATPAAGAEQASAAGGAKEDAASKTSGITKAAAKRRTEPAKGEQTLAKPKSTRKKRKERGSKVDPYADLVGTVPDRVVAEKAGVTIGAVRNWRVRRNIPAMSKRPDASLPPEPGEGAPAKASKPKKKRKKKRKGRRGPRKSKIDPYRSLVGTVPDRVVAEKAGVTPGAVLNYRKMRDIAAYNRSAPPASATGTTEASGAATAAPKASEPAEPASPPAGSAPSLPAPVVTAPTDGMGALHAEAYALTTRLRALHLALADAPGGAGEDELLRLLQKRDQLVDRLGKAALEHVASGGVLGF